MADDTVNIVVLGGSYAGLSVAHGFLEKVNAHLRITPTARRYRVVMVSPSTHLYWNISAPRGLVSPELIPHSKSFVSILEPFEKYSAHQFQFVQGTAINVEPTQRVVTVSLVGDHRDRRSRHSNGTGTVSLDGSNHRLSLVNSSTSSNPRLSQIGEELNLICIRYHALIIATGSSADSPLLSLHGRHERTIGALNIFHNKLIDASSVLVCGGGPAGCEIAGQLSSYFNESIKSRRADDGTQRHSRLSDIAKRLSHLPSPTQSASSRSKPRPAASRGASGSRFTSLLPTISLTDRRHYKTPAADRKPKLITLISGNERLLVRHPVAVAKKVESQLYRRGVHVLHNVRVISYQELPSGKTKVVLNNDDTFLVDCYVAATGVKPNTLFLPRELLDAAGYVVVDPHALRVSRAGERVYALGDCAAYSRNRTADVYDAAPALLHNLRNDLWAHELRAHHPYGGAETQIAALCVDAGYVPDPRVTQLMPLTRWGGAGMVRGWNVPGWVVWAMKGRDYRVDVARRVVRKGTNPYAMGTYLIPSRLRGGGK